MLIYNQHPVPLRYDHPRVRVVNAVIPPGTTLREIKTNMIALANPEAEFLHFWDDDDLYLPWHLEDCLNNIGDHVAWKPESNWVLTGGRSYHLASNMFEGTWVFRASYLKSSPQDTHPNYPDPPVFMQTLDNELLATTELRGRSNYIYRWGGEQAHHSGLGAVGTIEKQRQVMRYMQSVSKDVRKDGEMIAADLSNHWQHYLSGTKGLVSDLDWAANRIAVGQPDFEIPSSSSASNPVSRLVQRLNPLKPKH